MLNDGIVDKEAHTPFSRPTSLFPKIPQFLEIQDLPTSYNPIGKKIVLQDSFNRVAYIIYTLRVS